MESVKRVVFLGLFLVACSSSGGRSDGGTGGPDGGAPIGDGGMLDASTPPPPSTSVTVHLVPSAGVSGTTRVSFAVPLGMGWGEGDPPTLRVTVGGASQTFARRTLARHADGSARSVLVQLDVDMQGESDVVVELGAEGDASGTLVPVSDTLTAAGTPEVWAVLPAAWLSASGVVGPSRPEADVPSSSPLAAWGRICDYDEPDWGTDAFLEGAGSRAVWLYDRGTLFYRGYARRGDLETLTIAYTETELYRAGITGSGASTRIGVPGAASDLKYHYVQNLAIHYLLTGDDRFREAAENIAHRVQDLHGDPGYYGYAGGDDEDEEFWTEREAGFGLLAYVWAMVVTDDRATALRVRADEAVDAYVRVQETYPEGYDDPNARCFAHHGAAHDVEEGNLYFGCSPWMSAILADALDVYARESSGAARAKASTSIVKLGRMIAREGHEPDDRPWYFMGVDTPMDDPDDFDEHRGETAYVVAIAWAHTGGTEAALRTRADELVRGFDDEATVGQIRSFNWQCRSAVATPALLGE